MSIVLLFYAILVAKIVIYSETCFCIKDFFSIRCNFGGRFPSLAKNKKVRHRLMAHPLTISLYLKVKPLRFFIFGQTKRE